MSELTLTKLIERLERLLEQPGEHEQTLRQALSLAAEATRTPHGRRKQQLIREAQELLRQVLEGEQFRRSRK